MRPIDFKLVRYQQGIMKRLSGDDFGDSFLEVLTEHGRDCWDLKQVIRESGMVALLIFSREAPPA